MALNLVADRIVQDKMYPALAQHQAEPYTQSWREFEQHWPCTVPFRPQEYLAKAGIPVNIYTVSSFPDHCYYPIGLGFFNFGIDYFDLLPQTVFDAVLRGQLKLLFYYHEGDNPADIKRRLHQLTNMHQLGPNCYVFVSGNTAAAAVENFVYFPDFELWYYHRNRNVNALPIHNQPRARDFACLNRLHKSWRATVTADLVRSGVLDNSYWSYCETGLLDDQDNPIEIDTVPELRTYTQQFLAAGPYVSDELSQAERNNHANVELKYFVNAYCNIVMETHFDVDQSGGAFLTEKTFKPIKHGQMFFIVGGAGSLQQLRSLGYRVFDHVLDNRYDHIQNNTLRWQALRTAIAQAQPQLPRLFAAAQNDIVHNQQLFLAHQSQRLNTLIEKLHEYR
jgi:hypothetical protein